MGQNSKGKKVSPLTKKDLDVIKYEVEREFKVSLKSKSRLPKNVDARRVFVALVLNIYNKVQGTLGTSKMVTLMALAKYLRYKSHASIWLMIANNRKGNITLEEYLMRDLPLREKYLRLREKIEHVNTPSFRKFLLLRREELKEEIRAIEKYLNVGNEKKKVKNGEKTAL